MQKRAVWLVAFLLLAAAYPATKLMGQAVYGSIIGTVVDASGAAVPNAKVTITEVDKEITYSTTTNEAGNYTQTHLTVGRYRVRVEAPGFQAHVQENVNVMVDRAARVDATLQLGAVTQTVEVTAEIPLLKTERADVATTFQEKLVAELPIYNRNFTQFQLLTPGTQMLGWQHASSENPQGSIQISVNGQHFSGTGWQLDGTDNRDPILGIIVINPNLDSIGEIKLITQNYDAEFGANAGVMIAHTKSGTNELHGSAFLFRRNDLTMARQPFSQANPLPFPNTDPNKFIPDTLWNQFGGSIGGPIKRNKTFFFGDYQGTRRKNGGSVLTTVPTLLARAGDLSEYPADIFDPCNATLTDCNVAPANRTQFANNIIPSNRLSQQAQNLLALLPAPTLPGISNNYAASGTEKFDDDAFNARIDHWWSDRLRMFGRYSFAQFKRQGPGAFGELVGGPAFDNIFFAGKSDVRNQSVAYGFDYSVTPTWITDFRFGFFRYRVFVRPGGGGSPASDAGIPGLNLGDDATIGMPAFTIDGTGGFRFGYSLGVNQCNCPLDQEEQQFQFVNNWTKIQGDHTFKFGADIRYAMNLRVPSDSHRAGEVFFNNDRTRGGTGGGLGLATFLLGDVTFFQRYVSKVTDAAERQERLFFYGQDTWRVTPRLTVNYGLRWEIIYPEKVNAPGNGGWVDLRTGETLIGGTQGVDLRGNIQNTFTNFAPRLGIAYQLRPKTVLRLGYGRSFDVGVFGSVFGHAVTQNLPVLAGQEERGADPFLAAFSLADGPPLLDPATKLADNCNDITDPDGSIRAAGGTCLGPNGHPLWPDGVFGRVRPLKMRLPTVDAWNATLQHQLTETMAVEIGYVGNKGTHVFRNEAPGYSVNDPAVDGFAAGIPQVERRPFYRRYGWTQGFDYYGNDGDNRYHALLAKVEKRFTQGYSLGVAYTLQEAKNYGWNYYNINRSVDWGRNDFYSTHALTVTSVWDLPYGRGRTYGSTASRAADLLLGGWSVNQATIIYSGLPFDVFYRDCGADRDAGPCRPDVVREILMPRSRLQWFETATVPLDSNGDTSGPWRRPQVEQFGNVGRNPLTGPSFFNTDLTLAKNFQITERWRGQFRAEAFNLFNVANLSNPSSCIDCDLNPASTGRAGRINGLRTGAQMRRFQFALRFTF